MIPDFETYCLNEVSVRGIKKVLKGTMSSSDRHMMKKLLRKHIVYFSFRKRDGSLRKAIGTLIHSFLPALRGGSPKPEHQMVYYDLEKEHWRSFRSYSFIKIIWVKTKDEYLHKKHADEDEEEKKKKDIHKEEEKEKKHVPDKHDDHEEHDKHEEHEEKEDIKKKEYKTGEKIPEKELMRRSTDFRKGSRKNEFTKKSNDAKKKGELDDNDEDDDKKDKDED